MQLKHLFVPLQVMADSLLQVPARGANCEDDLDTFLFTLADAKQRELQEPAASVQDDLAVDQDLELPQAVKDILGVTLGVKDINRDETVDAQERNILAYIGGYICRRLFQKHDDCQHCATTLSMDITRTKQDHTFLSKKAYDEAKKGLIAPSDPFLDVLKEMESKYVSVVKQVLHMDKVRLRICSTVGNVPSLKRLSFHCNHADMARSYIVNMFVNMRLHHTLKLNNDGFESVGGRRNRKMMKFSHI